MINLTIGPIYFSFWITYRVFFALTKTSKLRGFNVLCKISLQLWHPQNLWNFLLKFFLKNLILKSHPELLPVLNCCWSWTVPQLGSKGLIDLAKGFSLPQELEFMSSSIYLVWHFLLVNSCKLFTKFIYYTSCC